MLPARAVSLSAVAIMVVSMAATSVQAQKVYSCKDYTNAIVKNSVEDILRPVVQKNPGLKKLSQKALVHKAGQMLMTAPNPSFKSYGFMMLLWYGGKEGRGLAAKGAPHFKTPADKAYLNLALGLFGMSSNSRAKAQSGRKMVAAMRKTGLIKTLTPEMWAQLTTKCQLPK